MLCHLFLKSLPKVALYVNIQQSTMSCLKMTCAQFCDSMLHEGGKIKLGESETTKNTTRQPNPQFDDHILRKKNAAADRYLNSLSDEMKEKKRYIELIYEDMKKRNKWVPDDLSSVDMKYLLTETEGTPGAVKRYFRLLYKKMRNKHVKQEKQLHLHEESILRGKDKINEKDGVSEVLNETKNTIFLHIPNSIKEKQPKKWQTMRTLLHGNTVILDLDYDLKLKSENLMFPEINKFLKWNSNQADPLLVKFTSAQGHSVYTSLIEHPESHHYGAAEIYKEHFTELYPRKQLVYLSPDAPPLPNKFDGDRTYIVGGYVVKGQRNKASYCKALELGIECRSFPVHRYFKTWLPTQRHRVFSIETSLKIMQTAYQCGDWGVALHTHLSDVFEPLPKKNINKLDFPLSILKKKYN